MSLLCTDDTPVQDEGPEPFFLPGISPEPDASTTNVLTASDNTDLAGLCGGADCSHSGDTGSETSSMASGLDESVELRCSVSLSSDIDPPRGEVPNSNN